MSTSERAEEREARTTDRFARPAHVVARSVGVVAGCARTCAGAVTQLGAWTWRGLTRPSRSVALASRQFASVLARPFKRLWRRPLHERVMAISACVAAIAFVATLLTSLAEPGTDVAAATGNAAAGAIGYLVFGLMFLALGNLPRASRWVTHVLEVASVELHRERRGRRIAAADEPHERDFVATDTGRLEVVVVDSSAPNAATWTLHRAVRRAAATVINSIADGTHFAVLAADNGDVRVLFPAGATFAPASDSSRRDAAVHLRLLWPSGELDLDRALRSARDLAALGGSATPHVTLVMADTHDYTVSISRTVDRLRGHFRCDAVVCGSGGNAAASIVSKLGGRAVPLEDVAVIHAVWSDVGVTALPEGWAPPPDVAAQG